MNLAELRGLMDLMREKGAVRVHAEGVDVVLGPEPGTPAPKKKRELTDLDFALAATEGFPDEEDSDPVSVPTQP